MDHGQYFIFCFLGHSHLNFHFKKLDTSNIFLTPSEPHKTKYTLSVLSIPENFKPGGFSLHVKEIDRSSRIRLATRVLVVALMAFIMTQQRTRTICNPKLIAIFARLENIQRANQTARM